MCDSIVHPLCLEAYLKIDLRYWNPHLRNHTAWYVHECAASRTQQDCPRTYGLRTGEHGPALHQVRIRALVSLLLQTQTIHVDCTNVEYKIAFTVVNAFGGTSWQLRME